MDTRGTRDPSRDALGWTRLREGGAPPEKLGSSERREKSVEGSPSAAPGALGAEQRGSWPTGPSSPPPRAGSPARSREAVGWDGRPAHLGELDL